MSGNVRNLQERPYRWSTVVLLLVFAAALFLRLRGLGFRDFWCDEISSIFFLEHPWRNWNAPLYWVLLHFWAKIFGITEFSLRLPGALFSFFTTVIIFFLGKALFNRKTAVLAALFSGLSAFHIWYAQDARDYSMLVFFGTLSSYILVLMLKTGDYRKLKWFVAVSCVGIYTNYFMLFLVAAQILYLLAVKRLRPDKRWWFFLVIPAVFALYLPRFIGKLKFVAKDFWIPDPSWKSFGIILQNYMLGYNGTRFLYAFSLLIILALFLVLFLYSGRNKMLRDSIYFCLFLLIVPAVLVFLFSKFFFSLYLNRCFILFSPYFYILLSQAAMELNRPLRRMLTGLLVLIFGCGAYLYFQGYMYPPEEYHPGAHFTKPVRPVADFLDKNVGDGDLVAFSGSTLMPGLNFYSRKKFPQYLFYSPEVKLSNGRRSRKENTYCLPLQRIPDMQFNKIWLVLLDREVKRGLDRSAIAVKEWFDVNLKLLSGRKFENSWVHCYEKADQPD